MLGPVPAEVPPHEPVNHSHWAPVPREPPVTVSTLLVPLQVLLLVIFTLDGAVDVVPTVTERDLPIPSPHALDAYTLIVPPEVAEVTVIVLELAPEVIIHPAGTVHVYDVAPVTTGTSYVSPVVFGQGAT